MSIAVKKGDITTISVDAIVNAANEGLRGGGGVDGAIHRAGGPKIMEECRMIGGCPTGQAVLTTAGNLPAKHVIHTVGPIWKGGHHSEDDLLANAYRNSLLLAHNHHLSTISFPNISTGVYGFPKDRAAKIAVNTAQTFNAEKDTSLHIIFVCFDDENFQLYTQLLNS